MSESGMPDISKVIGLILENPQLIEQISGLIKNEESSTEAATSDTPEITDGVSEPAPTEAIPASVTYTTAERRHGNRGKLLGSLKPYLSEKRAGAIDTMISIADILDAMRGV